MVNYWHTTQTMFNHKLEVRVSVGDYMVQFIDHKVDNGNFLDSKLIKATELAEDKDVGDNIGFEKVDASVKKQKDQLPKVKFEFPNIFSCVIDYDVTLKSGGKWVKILLQVEVRKDVFCPSCNQKTGVCVIRNRPKDLPKDTKSCWRQIVRTCFGEL